MTKTLSYYNKNAKQFSDGTREVDFKSVQDNFLKYLTPGDKILDFGCGSGRDSKAFIDAGYQVVAIDGSEELAKLASEYIGQEVRCQRFEELDEKEEYDGIWACASILHLEYETLVEVLRKMERALKPEGYLYTSFKYGKEDVFRDGRHFTNMTEERVNNMLEELNLFSLVDMKIGGDCRKDREEELWINLILKKKSMES